MLRSISTHFTHREQLLTPLQLTSTLGKVDIEATYTGPTGGASLAGALRLGISRALTSFVDKNVREQLRLGTLQCTSVGLLSSRSCFLFHIANFVKEDTQTLITFTPPFILCSRYVDDRSTTKRTSEAWPGESKKEVHMVCCFSGFIIVGSSRVSYFICSGEHGYF